MLRRSGPRSPTRCFWPTNSSRSRGRIRAASGWRSGGGWKRASGSAPVGSSGGGHAPMVARAADRRGGRRVRWPRGPVQVRRRPRARASAMISDPADERDPPDVAADVGVLLGGPDGQAIDDRGPGARSGAAALLRRRSVRLRASSAARSSATICASSSAARASSSAVRLDRLAALTGRRSAPAPAGPGRPARWIGGRWPGRVLPRARLAMVRDGPPAMVGWAGRLTAQGSRSRRAERIASRRSSAGRRPQAPC